MGGACCHESEDYTSDSEVSTSRTMNEMATDNDPPVPTESGAVDEKDAGGTVEIQEIKENKTNVSRPVVTRKNEKFPWVEEANVVNNVYDQFKVDKELGRGASCRVVKVTHKETKKQYAMKEMIRKDKWNPMLFEQEVYILSKLAGHNNILQYVDCYVDNKNFYVLTGLLKGGELFDKIKALRHFSEKQASETMKVIIGAMNHCHERGIVHRDLKPENIVFRNRDDELDVNASDLVIIDFGDAKEVEEHSQHDDFVGTAFYLAPEAIRQRFGWELKKSDMWTIGVIAYVLVTGRPPFWGRENKEIIRKIVRGNVRFPSTIKLSAACQEFILRLLQKDPKARPSAAEALQDPWITGESAADKAASPDILRNLATFGTANLLKQLIVETVAANLDKKHQKEYQQQFNNLDSKGDGRLDEEELKEFLVRCGLEEDVAQKRAAKVVLNIAGPDKNYITTEDWNHSNVAKLLSSNHLIERQYRKLDVDEDGYISCDDLLSIFEGTEPSEMMQMIEQVDRDEDGLINFEEFKRCMLFRPAYEEDDN